MLPPRGSPGLLLPSCQSGSNHPIRNPVVDAGEVIGGVRGDDRAGGDPRVRIIVGSGLVAPTFPNAGGRRLTSMPTRTEGRVAIAPRGRSPEPLHKWSAASTASVASDRVRSRWDCARLARTNPKGYTGGAGVVLWPRDELLDLHYWVFGEDSYIRDGKKIPLGPNAHPHRAGSFIQLRTYVLSDGLTQDAR